MLLAKLDANLPSDFATWENAIYVEPFVGGGAMLLHMLATYPNISQAIINDINGDLISAYRAIKKKPVELIQKVEILMSEYLATTDDSARAEIYYRNRLRFNTSEVQGLDRTALFLFLNRTCYNGLYRVNSKGYFNVPHGRYVHPSFLTRAAVMELSALFKSRNIRIFNWDFSRLTQRLPDNPNLFVYIDPPYRPISNQIDVFTSYDKSGFTDKDQERVKAFCDAIDSRGGKFLVSNSDSKKNDDSNESYFDSLYDAYSIEHFVVKRLINPYNKKNPNPGEILIRNY